MFWLRGERTVIRKCGLLLFCLLIKPSIYCGCITEVCALSVYPSARTHTYTLLHTCSTSSCSPTPFWLIKQIYVSWSCQLTMCNVSWQSRCHGMRACAFLCPVAQETSSTELCTPFQALMNISVCRHREGERSFFSAGAPQLPVWSFVVCHMVPKSSSFAHHAVSVPSIMDKSKHFTLLFMPFLPVQFSHNALLLKSTRCHTQTQTDVNKRTQINSRTHVNTHQSGLISRGTITANQKKAKMSGILYQLNCMVGGATQHYINKKQTCGQF